MSKTFFCNISSKYFHLCQDNHLDIILRGISERASNGGVTVNEMSSLQSLMVKLLSHFECLEDVFCLNHFPEILDVMHGKSQDVVFLHILNMATRGGPIRDPTSIQLLSEISQTLHDNMEFMNVKDDDSQVARSVSRFVHMVDYGTEMERHLAFLVDCRATFGRFNDLKETLVHSSNSLAIQSLKCAKKDLSFFKSCVTFSEVTIPSISSQRQFDLFLETAEVASLGGLVSHVDGLISSGISCLHTFDRVDGFRTPADVEGLVSSIRKLCGFLIMVPGNISLPVTYFPNNLITLISSQSWFDPKMRTQVFSAILLLLTTLSQKILPYHANAQIPGNDMLYYGDSSYKKELVSLSKVVLDNLLCAVQQEPSQAARGCMALETCNCIASSFLFQVGIQSLGQNLKPFFFPLAAGSAATRRHFPATFPARVGHAPPSAASFSPAFVLWVSFFLPGSVETPSSFLFSHLRCVSVVSRFCRIGFSAISIFNIAILEIPKNDADSTKKNLISYAFHGTPVITTEKLNGGKNYLNWHSSVEIWFLGQRLSDHLTKKASEIDDKSKDEWEAADYQLVSVLWNSIEPKLMVHFRPYRSCYEVWQKAKNLYANDIQRLYESVRNLSTLQMTDNDLSEYLARAQSTIDGLKLMLVSDDPKKVLEKLDNMFMVFILHGLPREYGAVRDQALTNTTIPTVENLIDRLTRVSLTRL
ncbi:VPS35 endosomal protein sorting factor [Trifolium repens]|nr:VPS35 endosomal protein sorting factor [Trifolium repens]